jgi:hypothetical protein
MKRASTVQVAQRSRDEEKKIHQVHTPAIRDALNIRDVLFLINALLCRLCKS